MPTCPGCHEHLSYHTIPSHLQFCEVITGTEPNAVSVMEYFDSRIARMEHRLEARLEALQTDQATIPTTPQQ